MQAQFGDLEFDARRRSIRAAALGDFGNVISDPLRGPIYGGPATVDLDGASTPFAPKFTGNIGAAYTFHLGQALDSDELTMTPRLDLAYHGDAYARSLSRTPRRSCQARHFSTATSGLTAGPWGLELWGTNLTDLKYVSAKQNVDVGSVTGVVGPAIILGIVYGGQRRLLGIRLSRTF